MCVCVCVMVVLCESEGVIETKMVMYVLYKAWTPGSRKEAAGRLKQWVLLCDVDTNVCVMVDVWRREGQEHAYMCLDKEQEAGEGHKQAAGHAQYV